MPLPSAKDLQKLAPQASLPTLELALTAYACASASQGGDNGLLTVIDYSRPSRDKRLWVFDLKARKLLFEEWVTHGKNSGDDLATSFSNRPNSYQSSIGLFQTGQLYTGKHGQSLRLVGLEPGFNDKSEERAIVMHSAAYADPRVVPGLGRLEPQPGLPCGTPGRGGPTDQHPSSAAATCSPTIRSRSGWRPRASSPAELRRGTCGAYAGSHRQPAQMNRRGGSHAVPFLPGIPKSQHRYLPRGISSDSPLPHQKRNRACSPARRLLN